MPPKQVEQKVTCSSNFWHGENKHFDMQISPHLPTPLPGKKKKKNILKLLHFFTYNISNTGVAFVKGANERNESVEENKQ